MLLTILVIAIILLILILVINYFSKPKEKVNPTQKPTIKGFDEEIIIGGNDLTDIIDDIKEPTEPYYLTLEKTRLVERKTFVEGRLIGKFYGNRVEFSEDYERSDFFDFTIYEAEIISTKNQIYKSPIKPAITGKEIKVRDNFYPEDTLLIINDANSQRRYKVKLHDVLLKNIYYPSQLQQRDGDEVFGTIKADIVGFILDFVEEKYTETILVGGNIDTTTEGPETTDGGNWPPFVTPPPPSPEPPPISPPVKTGRYQHDIRWFKKYISYEYKRHTGELFWGPWIFVEKVGVDWAEILLIIAWIILGICGLITIIALLILSWKAALILISITLLSLLANYTSLSFPRFAGGLFKILSTLFLLFMLSGLVYSLFDGFKMRNLKYATTDDNSKTARIENDSLISHVRIWKDYNDTNYITRLTIRKKDLALSNAFHSNINKTQGSSQQILSEVYSDISSFDNNKLDLIYNELLYLKKTRNIHDSRKFAEVIVSCVQSIPYVAVMESTCNPSQYENREIREMLMKCECKGFVKYGIQTPIEFMADLKGDCDTRTLLLFTLLKRFGYDAAIFNSDEYMHSVLGINLPVKINAPYKAIKKGDYYLWETTAGGMEIGNLSPDIENTNNWDLYIK
jgi:hypothetical protein